MPPDRRIVRWFRRRRWCRPLWTTGGRKITGWCHKLAERVPVAQHKAQALPPTHEVRAMGDYDRTYRWSLDDPEGFWAEAAKDVDWHRPPDAVFDGSNAPFYRWFV